MSSGGGQQVRWSAVGSELFFIGADHQLMSVRVTFTSNGRVTLGPSVPLFRTDFENNFQARQQYRRDERRSAIPRQHADRHGRFTIDFADPELEGQTVSEHRGRADVLMVARDPGVSYLAIVAVLMKSSRG